MQKNPNNKLSDAERKAMNSMASAQAPSDLEGRTIAALTMEGLINKKGGFRMKLITTFAAASAIKGAKSAQFSAAVVPPRGI